MKFLNGLQYAYEIEEQISKTETHADMDSAASEAYTTWDAELNNFYGILKGALTESEMDKLNKEEVDYILIKQNRNV